MNPSVRRVAPSIVVALFAISSALGANNFDPTQFSTGNFHGCPPTGQGSDPYLNSLKNRDKPPTTSMAVYTVDQLYQVTPSLPNRKVHRDKWTAAQRNLAAQWESHPVVIEGYLIHPPVREKAEACNCGSTTYVDHHMWLGPTATAARTRAMVVEISPRAWPNHPTWKSATATLKPIVDNREKVRVAGWLTWDQEHKEQLGKDTPHLVGSPPDPPDSSLSWKSVGHALKTLKITCQFPDHYNAFPIGRGEMDIFTPEGPRIATLTGWMDQLEHRKWEVELQYDEEDMAIV